MFQSWKKNGDEAREGETDLFLPSNASGNNPSSYYFLLGDNNEGGTTASVRDADGGEVIETVPDGASNEDFASRPVGQVPRFSDLLSGRRQKGGFWQNLLGGRPDPTTTNNRPYGEVGTLVRERRVPIKVEPKVFFANERTFLSWMHSSILLAGASVAIVAVADTNPVSQIYGLILLPVSIAFICYSMYQYSRRAAMIRRKDPGPYEDTVGPTVLAVMLMVTIVAQFVLKLCSLM
mmetsp:Transcript_31228/g.71897  ORF Transcript_31228/g.71897 Transcript_31228/m.71897 type:complete len:235 (+) Transcript_31228:69-773(+)